MEPSAFDTLARAFATSGSRRWLVRLVATLPLARVLTTSSEGEAAAQRPIDRVQGRNPRRNRKQHINNGNRKKNKNKNKGGGRGGTLSCLAPPLNLQLAFDQANAGDTLALCAGTFLNISLSVTKPMTIAGFGAGNTILQADNNHYDYFVSVNNGVDVTLADLTLTGWSGGQPGGALYNGGGTVTLIGVSITDNDSGGIYNAGGTVDVGDGSQVKRNYGIGGIFQGHGTVIIENSENVCDNMPNCGPPGALDCGVDACLSRGSRA